MFKVEDAAAARPGLCEPECNLVIAHGSQYGTSRLAEIALNFPDEEFCLGTTVDTFKDKGRNVFAYTANASQGKGMCRVMAAELTKSKIGVVGPIAVGDALLYVERIQKGA
ncbi:MAG: hypothetical protein U0401_28455 [Anaerolineae bacterium]